MPSQKFSKRDVKDDGSCPKATDGKHIPDPESIATRSSKEMVVDIWCKNCGCSGSVTIDPKNVLW